MKKYKAGVLFGEELEALYKDAKDNQFALPAVNTTGTNTINATLEAAAKVCQTINCRPTFPEVYPEPCIFTMLQNIMVCRLYCTPITPQKNGYPGSAL